MIRYIILKMFIIYKKENNTLTYIAKNNSFIDAFETLNITIPKDDINYTVINDNIVSHYIKKVIVKNDIGWIYNSTINETMNELVGEYHIVEIDMHVFDDEIKKQVDEIEKKQKIKKETLLERIKNHYNDISDKCIPFNTACIIGTNVSCLKLKDAKKLMEWCKEKESKDERPDIKNLMGIIFKYFPDIQFIGESGEVDKYLEAADYGYPLAYYNLMSYYVRNKKKRAYYNRLLINSGYDTQL